MKQRVNKGSDETKLVRSTDTGQPQSILIQGRKNYVQAVSQCCQEVHQIC